MFLDYLKTHSLSDFDFHHNIFPKVTDRAFWEAFPRIFPKTDMILPISTVPTAAVTRVRSIGGASLFEFVYQLKIATGGAEVKITVEKI